MMPGVNSTGSSWIGTGGGGGGGALERGYRVEGGCCTKVSCICGSEEDNGD